MELNRFKCMKCHQIAVSGIMFPPPICNKCKIPMIETPGHRRMCVLHGDVDIREGKPRNLERAKEMGLSVSSGKCGICNGPIVWHEKVGGIWIPQVG